MRVLAISHQRDAGPGVFADAVRAAGAELETWHIAETRSPPAEPAGYDAVMTFGGSMHADQADRHPWIADERTLLAELVERETPLLGVCLGAQLLSEALGGDAHRVDEPEIGWFEVEVTAEGADDPVIGPLAPRFEAFEWHSYACGLPPEVPVLARSPVCAQAYRAGEAAWGIQFHAEVTAGDVERWTSDYASDRDAVAHGVSPEALRAATAPRIEAWNALGAELCARFVAVAARRPAPRG